MLSCALFFLAMQLPLPTGEDVQVDTVYVVSTDSRMVKHRMTYLVIL